MISEPKSNNRSRSIARAMLGSCLLAAAIGSSSGCRLCCDSEDVAYSAYGGSWARTNRDHGRVGSLFDPGGAMVPDLSERETVDGDGSSRSPILPPANSSGEDPSEVETIPAPPEPKSDAEREQEFQDKLKKIREEELQSAKVIPGTPMPPNLR